MKQDLRNRTVVVTGAARGIGGQVARLAVARAAQVGLIGLERDRLRDLADDLGSAATWREADVRDGGALRAAIDECAEALEGIDYVVANAGVVAYGTVRQAEEAAFERVLDVNLNGGVPDLEVRNASSAAEPGPRDRRGVGAVLPGAAGHGVVRRQQGRRRDACSGLSPGGCAPGCHGRPGAPFLDRHGPREGRRGTATAALYFCLSPGRWSAPAAAPRPTWSAPISPATRPTIWSAW